MITGNKVLLRPLKKKDLKEFFSLREIMRLQFEFFSQDLGSEYLFEKTFYETGFWEKTNGYVLILDLNDRIIGTIGYNQSMIFEGYDLHFCIFKEEDRGFGFMKESLKLFSEYLFTQFPIERLQLLIPNYHRAAIAVGQKSGYIFEGIARRAAFYRGKYTDLCIYSLLKAECNNFHRLL